MQTIETQVDSEVARYYLGSYLAGERNDAALDERIDRVYQSANGPEGIYICVLFSANDAYMRDFRIVIPSDCVASEDAESNRQVLILMERVLKADISPSPQLEFENTKVIFNGET